MRICYLLRKDSASCMYDFLFIETCLLMRVFTYFASVFVFTLRNSVWYSSFSWRRCWIFECPSVWLVEWVVKGALLSCSELNSRMNISLYMRHASDNALTSLWAVMSRLVPADNDSRGWDHFSGNYVGGFGPLCDTVRPNTGTAILGCSRFVSYSLATKSWS